MQRCIIFHNCGRYLHIYVYTYCSNINACFLHYIAVPNTPDAPAYIPDSATGVTPQDHTIALTWAAVLNNNFDAMTYEVLRENDGFVYKGLSPYTPCAANYVCAVLGNIVLDTFYTFAVRAVNSIGASAWSVSSSSIFVNGKLNCVVE